MLIFCLFLCVLFWKDEMKEQDLKPQTHAFPANADMGGYDNH